MAPEAVPRWRNPKPRATVPQGHAPPPKPVPQPTGQNFGRAPKRLIELSTIDGARVPGMDKHVGRCRGARRLTWPGADGCVG